MDISAEKPIEYLDIHNCGHVKSAAVDTGAALDIYSKSMDIHTVPIMDIP